MDEKRKYKKENAETKNQFEKCTDLSAVEFIEKAFDSLWKSEKHCTSGGGGQAE